MAQSVVINGVTYPGVPAVDIPLSGGGTAEFTDTSDANLDSGSKMLAGNSAYAGGVKYDGAIPTNDSSDVTASGDTVSFPAGYYGTAQSKTIPSGAATAPNTVSGTSAAVSTGTNTLTLTKSVSITPEVTPGYVSEGTAKSTSVSLTASVTTKAAATITPGTSDVEIAADTYLTGKQTIKGDANLLAQNIKSGVSIFGVAGGLTSATVSQDPTTKVLSIS